MEKREVHSAVCKQRKTISDQLGCALSDAYFQVIINIVKQYRDNDPSHDMNHRHITSHSLFQRGYDLIVLLIFFILYFPSMFTAAVTGLFG
jgi:hypothetical protein